MIRRVLALSTAIACTVGLVGIVGTGVAAAHPTKPPKSAPVSATGTTTCNIHGRVLTGSTGTVTIRANMTPAKHAPACSSQGGTKLRTGHLTGLTSTATITGVCSLLTGGSLPDVAGGTIRWSPKPKVAGSTGVALTGGSASVVTVGSDTFLRIAYSGGSVAGGSFTNASGASLTATSRQDIKELTAECAKGPIEGIAVYGSLTL